MTPWDRRIASGPNASQQLCSFDPFLHNQQWRCPQKAPSPTPSTEVIKERGYSKAADVYSLAIVVWEVLTQQEPYKGVPIHEAPCPPHASPIPPMPPPCPLRWRRITLY